MHSALLLRSRAHEYSFLSSGRLNGMIGRHRFPTCCREALLSAECEIFNPRIVPDSLIFISVVAARWPGPPGELNLRGCEPPAYSPPGRLPVPVSERRASEYSSRWRMQVKRRMQQTDEAMSI